MIMIMKEVHDGVTYAIKQDYVKVGYHQLDGIIFSAHRADDDTELIRFVIPVSGFFPYEVPPQIKLCLLRYAKFICDRFTQKPDKAFASAIRNAVSQTLKLIGTDHIAMEELFWVGMNLEYSNYIGSPERMEKLVEIRYRNSGIITIQNVKPLRKGLNFDTVISSSNGMYYIRTNINHRMDDADWILTTEIQDLISRTNQCHYDGIKEPAPNAINIAKQIREELYSTYDENTTLEYLRSSAIETKDWIIGEIFQTLTKWMSR